ncbi:GAP family protein [Solirubrobacter phytolaccae]|uniref:GAP family protein n=1 Tax=Solirubrobacter phytolaccae TaxID=1404360 RepID=A0A9X3NCD0_9ACTN|nr:GAP family protein [Solirubrobacter phytolaccae]MDA0183436.1 GAP family protein [Solirubrobacter phytolaccae]
MPPHSGGADDPRSAMDVFLTQFISAAVIGALSPAAVLATIAVLAADRHALRNAVCLLLGWTFVLVALAAFMRLVLGAGGGGLADSTKAILNLILGQVLISFGLRRIVGHRVGAQVVAHTPGWMQALDDLTALKALGMGALLLLISPADLAVYLSALQGIQGADLSDPILANLALVVAIDLCILMPLSIYVLMPRRASHILGAGRTWLIAHMHAVAAGSMLVFGALLTLSGALHLLT